MLKKILVSLIDFFILLPLGYLNHLINGVLPPLYLDDGRPKKQVEKRGIHA
ncbi:MAG: hypothetical protein PHR36_02080 [Patescibacteria group bacterium]|nr:hypothetical protein [Patescibacteria group bacterium]